MAVLTMANDNNKDCEKPLFHDFLTSGLSGETRPSEPSVSASASASASLGASSAGPHAPVSATSDLGSERQMGNHFEGVPVHGLRGDFSAAEISNRLLGRKRSNPDSIFMGFSRDRMPQVGPESLENSHLMKLFRSSGMGERPRRSHDDELLFGMQPPKPASTSHLILQSPLGNRPDSMASKWDQSVLMNAGPSTHYPPRVGQFSTYAEKVSSNKYRDNNAGPSVISQPAADEGSRTGIKGSGILSGVNASSGASERNSSGVLLSSSRPMSGPQSAPESSTTPSRHGITSASRQMTIFYAGQAHVFDEVHPNKADVIMALAGSNGGSWSTTYSPKSSTQTPPDEVSLPSLEKGMAVSSLVLPKESRGRLPNPGYGFVQVGQQILTSDPLNSSFGEQQGSMTGRHSKPMTPAAEPNIEGKRDVR